MTSNTLEIIIKAIDQASATFDQIKGKGQVVSKDLEASFLKLGAVMTGAGVAAKLLADNINQSYLSFDHASACVASLGAATEEEMKRMEDAAIRISETMPITAKEVMDGFYMMQSAGYDAATSIESMDAIARMAVGGQLEMSDAVNAVTMILDVYGAKAGDTAHVTDVLTGTVQMFKTTLPELQMEMSKSVASANSLGISFEEVAAMSGMLKKDFVSAETAGTALKSMLVQLTKTNVQKYLESIGVSVKDADGNFVGMKSILDQLDVALGTMGGEVDRNTALVKIFGSEGVIAAQSLMRQKDDLGAYTTKLEEGGQALESFNKIMESTASQLEIAENKMNNAKIALGEAMAPATLLAADAMSYFADILKAIPEPLQATVGALIMGAQALAPMGILFIALPPLINAVAGAKAFLAATMLGTVVPAAAAETTALFSAAAAEEALAAAGLTVSPSMIAAAGGMSTATVASGGLLATLAPILPIVLAIAAAAALLYLAWTNNWGGIQETTKAAMDSIKSAIGDGIAYMQERFAVIGQAMAPAISKLQELGGTVAEKVSAGVGRIAEAFKKLNDGVGIMETLGKAFDNFTKIWDIGWKLVGKIVEVYVDWIVKAIEILCDKIEFLLRIWEKVMDNPVAKWIKDILGGAIESVTGNFDDFGTTLDKIDAALTETGDTAVEEGKKMEQAAKDSAEAEEESAEQKEQSLKKYEEALKSSGKTAEEAAEMAAQAADKTIAEIDQLANVAVTKSGEIDAAWSQPATKQLFLEMMDTVNAEGTPYDGNSVTPYEATGTPFANMAQQNGSVNNSTGNFQRVGDKVYYTDFAGKTLQTTEGVIPAGAVLADGSIAQSAMSVSQATTSKPTTGTTTSKPTTGTTTGSSSGSAQQVDANGKPLAPTGVPYKQNQDGTYSTNYDEAGNYVGGIQSSGESSAASGSSPSGVGGEYTSPLRDESGTAVGSSRYFNDSEGNALYYDEFNYATGEVTRRDATGKVIAKSQATYKSFQTKEYQNAMENVVDSTEGATKATEENAEAVADASKTSSRAILQVGDSASKTAETVSDAAVVTEEAAGQIAESNDKIVGSNVATAEESATAAETMNTEVTGEFGTMQTETTTIVKETTDTVIEAFKKMQDAADALSAGAGTGTGAGVTTGGGGSSGGGGYSGGSPSSRITGLQDYSRISGNTDISGAVASAQAAAAARRAGILPAMAEGGDVLEGGKAIVGEEGIELVDLPSGASVRPLSKKGDLIDYNKLAKAIAQEMRRMGGTGGKENHYHIGTLIADDASMKKLARTINRINLSENARTGAT